MKKMDLQAIQEVYKRGENVIQYLNNGSRQKNTREMVMISYDLQSGSYIRQTKKNPAFNERYTKAIANVINGLGVPYNSILEVGVGEATTLAHLVPKLNIAPRKIYGFDLSWSRIRYAIEYMKRRGTRNPLLFMADLFNIPLQDHSIDIVYTSHSIEPNGGREKEALLELMRITKKYLVLLEPAYEFASKKAKERMKRHGYIRNLHAKAQSLGLDVIEHRLFDVSVNPMNPTGLLVIRAASKKKKLARASSFLCPVTHTSLERVKGAYFSNEGLLAYPIIDGVPCLLEENAVIATHFLDKFSTI